MMVNRYFIIVFTLVCCIFKKQKEFGESSDESSSDSDSNSSGSESDGGPVSSSSGKGKDGKKGDHGSCDHADHNHHGSKKTKKRVLNEYERMPKGKADAVLGVIKNVQQCVSSRTVPDDNFLCCFDS
jgi:hypothetical protein